MPIVNYWFELGIERIAFLKERSGISLKTKASRGNLQKGVSRFEAGSASALLKVRGSSPWFWQKAADLGKQVRATRWRSRNPSHWSFAMSCKEACPVTGLAAQHNKDLGPPPRRSERHPSSLEEGAFTALACLRYDPRDTYTVTLSVTTRAAICEFEWDLLTSCLFWQRQRNTQEGFDCNGLPIEFSRAKHPLAQCFQQGRVEFDVRGLHHVQTLEFTFLVDHRVNDDQAMKMSKNKAYG